MTTTNQHEEKQTLKSVSHTAPTTNESFGTTMAYHRGRIIAADGGNEESRAQEQRATLSEIDHTPPEAIHVNVAFERGQPQADTTRGGRV